MRTLRFLAAAALLSVAPPALAQQSPPATDPFAGIPAAKPEDVVSVDAILKALYGAISGDVGQKREWDRFRSLFYPGAKLVPTGTPKDATRARARLMTPDDYVRTSGPFLERIGFHEVEIARKVEEYGHIAHAFSTYEGRAKAELSTPIRGINSIQLFHDGTRWWILNVFWMQESEHAPLPAAYLPRPR